MSDQAMLQQASINPLYESKSIPTAGSVRPLPFRELPKWLLDLEGFFIMQPSNQDFSEARETFSALVRKIPRSKRQKLPIIAEMVAMQRLWRVRLRFMGVEFDGLPEWQQQVDVRLKELWKRLKDEGQALKDREGYSPETIAKLQALHERAQGGARQYNSGKARQLEITLDALEAEINPEREALLPSIIIQRMVSDQSKMPRKQLLLLDELSSVNMLLQGLLEP